MSHARQLKNAARLREVTHLGAMLPNETRWNGKFDMVERYFKLEDFFRTITELDDHLPSPSNRRALEKAMQDFKNFSSISTCLQKEGLLLNDARQILDHVCEDYPEMSNYLSSSARIVHCKPFEDAMVKIMGGNENNLSALESKSSENSI